MDSVTKVQLLREPIDELKNGGPVSIKAMNTPAHPVQAIQQKADLSQNMMQKALAARVFGSHMAVRMQMEESILSQVRRGPGLKSSLLGLEVALGKDETVDFADFLGNPEFSETPMRPHEAFEKRLFGSSKTKQ